MLNIVDGLSLNDVLLLPKYSSVKSRKDVDISVTLSKDFKFSLPFTPSNMATVTELNMAKTFYEHKSLSILHRFNEFSRQLEWLEEIKNWQDGTRYIGFSIGVKDDDYTKVDQLVQNGAQIILIDIAHGWSEHCIKMTNYIADKYKNVLLISGNVACGNGAIDLWTAGADVVKCNVGSGCFAAGTRILMANGYYKNIENIVCGDYVINKDGKPVKVLNAFSTGYKAVAKLRNNLFHKATYVTPDHQFWVGDLNNNTRPMHTLGYAKTLDKKDRSPGKPSKYKWKEIGQTNKDLLLLPNKINFILPETFKIELAKRTGGNWRGLKYEIDNVIIPSYETGYLFGTFLGDGNASVAEHNGSNIGAVHWYYGLNELHIVNKTIKCIRQIFPNVKVSYTTTNSIYQINMYYKPLADYLTKWGKKKEKKLPEELLVNSIEYLQGLFDGLVDSDGSYLRDGRIAFCNTSTDLIELFNVITFILEGAFPSNVKKQPTTGGLANCNIENCNPSYVARIRKKANLSLTKDYQIVEKLEYETINQAVPVYDIEVDCPTHSFIADNMIVHNSLCSTRIRTGCGAPAILTLQLCREAKLNMENVSGRKAYLMQDGGAVESGDVAKILALADLYMGGNIFAGTDETPGNVINKEMNGGTKKYKKYVGSSTHKSTFKEGVETLKEYRGSVKPIIEQLCEGIRSCCSYNGVFNLEDLKKDPQWVKITASGYRESTPHDHGILL